MIREIDEILQKELLELPFVEVGSPAGKGIASLRPMCGILILAGSGQIDDRAAGGFYAVPGQAVDAADIEFLRLTAAGIGEIRKTRGTDFHARLLFIQTIARGIAELGEVAADAEAVGALISGRERKDERMEADGLSKLSVA